MVRFAYRSIFYFLWNKIKLLAQLSILMFDYRSISHLLWNKVKLLAKLSMVRFAYRSTSYILCGDLMQRRESKDAKPKVTSKLMCSVE
jgi:hypothetical protein